MDLQVDARASELAGQREASLLGPSTLVGRSAKIKGAILTCAGMTRLVALCNIQHK